jgi:hypothetical protein
MLQKNGTKVREAQKNVNATLFMNGWLDGGK